MNKEENGCMLKEITSFLIKVGEHCLSCEGKTIEPTTTKTNFKSTVELQAGSTYMVPTDIDMSQEIQKDKQEFKKYLEPKKQQEIEPKPKKDYAHSVKKSYLEKWITKGIFEVFTLEQFLRAYPKQRSNKLLGNNILKLLKTKKIAQLSKDRYMVNR